MTKQDLIELRYELLDNLADDDPKNNIVNYLIKLGIFNQICEQINDYDLFPERRIKKKEDLFDRPFDFDQRDTPEHVNFAINCLNKRVQDIVKKINDSEE